MSAAVGDMLARLRIERGWSQTCFAEQLNTIADSSTLDRNLISRWERGLRAPGPYWQPHIAKLLDIDPAELRAAVRNWYNANGSPGHRTSASCPHHPAHGLPSVRYRRLP